MKNRVNPAKRKNSYAFQRIQLYGVIFFNSNTCFGRTPSKAPMTTMSIILPKALVRYLNPSVTAFIDTGA